MPVPRRHACCASDHVVAWIPSLKNWQPAATEVGFKHKKFTIYVWRAEREGEDTNTRMSIDVRLGAIYALQRLAQDSERDRETISNVLAAYVREHDPKPKAKPPARPDTDVQAAMTVLGTLYSSDEYSLCDLTQVREVSRDLAV